MQVGKFGKWFYIYNRELLWKMVIPRIEGSKIWKIYQTSFVYLSIWVTLCLVLRLFIAQIRNQEECRSKWLCGWENFAKFNNHLQGVLAIRGLEFRGFAIRGFLKSSKCLHFAINPSFLELKMLKSGFCYHINWWKNAN